MVDINAIFKNKRLDEKKLCQNDFILNENCYTRDFSVMNGQFLLRVFITKEGSVDYKVFDTQTNDEYVLARVTGATGSFIGEVNKACEDVFKKISEECFYTQHFENPQTKRVLKYIKEKYGTEPEFLWEKFPYCAALRVRGKKSWFGVIMRVEKSKFGLSEKGEVDVLTLKNTPEDVTLFIKQKQAFTAYHMNKKYWCSIFIDESLSDKQIFSFIDKSYSLVDLNKK